MPKLFAGNYKKIDDHTVEITVQKTQEQAVIYPFPVAKEILNKYSLNGFKHLNINTNPDEQEDKSREYVRKTDDHIKKYVRMQGPMKKSPTQNNVEVKRPL